MVFTSAPAKRRKFDAKLCRNSFGSHQLQGTCNPVLNVVLIALFSSAVRIDYFCSRLLVDYLSTIFRTIHELLFNVVRKQLNKRLSMGRSCYDLLQ